jgi:hypothetical protein
VKNYKVFNKIVDEEEVEESVGSNLNRYFHKTRPKDDISMIYVKAANALPAKKAPVKKPADSNDDESEDELQKKTQPAKKIPVKKPIDSDDDIYSLISKGDPSKNFENMLKWWGRAARGFKPGFHNSVYFSETYC